MLFKNLKNSLEGLRAEANWLRVSLFAMAATNIVLGLALVNKETVVTITPWTLTDPAQVTEASASQNYYESWGMAIAILIGNVQPGNVNFIAERLKPLLSPEIYHETLDAIHANAQTLRDERISIRFEPREVVYEKSTGKVFVYGRSYTRIGNSLEDEYENERTYEFKFSIEQYAPILHYINTYEGRPMTKNAIEKAEKDRHREEMRERKKAEKQGIRYRPKAEDEVKNQ